MIELAKQSSPCAGKGPPPPPPCPPPPPFEFPWIYPIVIAAVISFIGLFYKWWLWRESQKKLASVATVWRPRPFTRVPYVERDLPACVQYLIVGTGAAGWEAYRAIRDHDPKYKVFFVSKEDTFPYKRTAMSKHMWWNGLPPDMRTLNYLEDGKRRTMYVVDCKHFIDPVKFFRKKSGPAASIALGWCVNRVDADAHCIWITTACGEVPIYYERCLLAPGAYAKNLSVFKNAPKAVREKATVLRTIRDLELAYRKARDAKHVTIVGAGPLGCELAYFMGRMQDRWFPPPEDPDYKQPEILLLYKGKGVLSSLVPTYLGQWAAEKIKCETVKLKSEALIYDAFLTDEGRLELTLSTGESIITDYVIVAIGSSPRIEMAAPSFLETDPINGGFLVNTEMEARTHLWIAGDAASVYSQWKNYRMRMPHLYNAQEQGYIAGSNMTGYWVPSNVEPHFDIKLGHELEIEVLHDLNRIICGRMPPVLYRSSSIHNEEDPGQNISCAIVCGEAPHLQPNLLGYIGQVVGEVGACMPSVGVFKPCEKEEMTENIKKFRAQLGYEEKPCFKEDPMWRERFKKGVIFYLRDDIVVGMMFWNLAPIEDRLEVATEMLRARPCYKDITLMAQQLGFPELQCTYLPKEMIETPICIGEVSKWKEYEDYEKYGQLSQNIPPDTVLYKNKPLAD